MSEFISLGMCFGIPFCPLGAEIENYSIILVSAGHE